MGLLDDYGPLLKGKPKTLPPDFAGPLKTPSFNGAPFKAPMDFGISDLSTSPPGADQQKSMAFALDDIAPSAQAPGAATTPGGKIGTQLAEGNPMLPPTGGGAPVGKPLSLLTAGQETPLGLDSGPKKLSLLRSGTENEPRTELGLGLPDASPTSGLLAANSPLPPPRPAGLGGMPPTRSTASMPLPPPRPAGLGGAAEVASTTAPPMPPVRPPGLGLEATGGMMASAPPIAPIAPSIAPIAPPIAPPTPAPQAQVGAAGGAMGGLGGLGSALGGIAKAIQGKPGPPPPQAKAPQITPSSAGPETSQQQAKASAQAPQILQGLLAQDKQDTLDPRKRRMG